MTQLFDLTIVGLAFGSVYALLSIGLVLIYRVSRVVNLAHGAIGVFAAYVYWFVFLESWDLPVGLAFALTPIVGALLGAAAERFFISPVRSEGPLPTLIMTIGLLLVLSDATVQIWGPTSPAIPSIFSDEVIEIGSSGMTVHQLGTTGVVIALLAGLSFVLNRTRYGLAIESIAQDPGASRLVGIPVSRIVTLVWAAAGAMAALAGLLFIHLNTLDPVGLTFVLIAALVATVLGRFTSFTLAVTGSFGIGVVFSLAQGYVTTAGSANAFVFALLLAILLLSRKARQPESAPVEY